MEVPHEKSLKSDVVSSLNKVSHFTNLEFLASRDFQFSHLIKEAVIMVVPLANEIQHRTLVQRSTSKGQPREEEDIVISFPK